MKREEENLQVACINYLQSKNIKYKYREVIKNV